MPPKALPPSIPPSFYILDDAAAEVELRIGTRQELIVIYKGVHYACAHTFVTQRFTAYLAPFVDIRDMGWHFSSHSGGRLIVPATPMRGTFSVKANGDWTLDTPGDTSYIAIGNKVHAFIPPDGKAPVLLPGYGHRRIEVDSLAAARKAVRNGVSPSMKED